MIDKNYMNKVNNKELFQYNIRTICTAIDSVNSATGETVKLRICSFVNLLIHDPFLGPTFTYIFTLSIRYPLQMKTDDLFPSIDMPQEPIAQIIFVLNLMYACTKDSFRSIFDTIFKIYGSGQKTTDFITHILSSPLKLLKDRLTQLSIFSWSTLQESLSEILFPNYAFEFLIPDSLPQELCLNKDRFLLYLKKAHFSAEEIEILSKDIDLYIKNHNSYKPDIFFIKAYLAEIAKYGGRTALSAILSTCTNSMLVRYILEADPAVPVKKRGRKPNSVKRSS